MKTREISSIAKLTATLLLGVALAASPAMADRGGNGGNGGNGGGSSHAGGNGKGQGGEHSKAGKDKNSGDTDSDTDTDTEKPDDTSTTTTVKTYGTINGFLHASANGIKHASSKSAVGSVRDAFLAATAEGTTFTQDSLVAALQPYSKKPITKDTVLAINERLHVAGLITDDTYNAVLTGTP